MTRLLAIAGKQVQLQELIACVRYFKVRQFRLHLFLNQGRINPDSVRLLIDELCPGVRFGISTFDIDNRSAIREILEQDSDIVALPLYRSSAFYRRIPSLRKRSGLVHVTDGIGDLFTMWELQRAVLAKTPVALIKGAMVLPQLALCRADLEFNLFHPRKSPYAKRSLPVGPFPMTAAKRRLLDNLFKAHRPGALVIEGFDLTAERIAADAGLTSYIATRRDGGITINGQVYLPDEVICAEEVLDVMRPDLVIGVPSTSLTAARAVHDNLPVFCITTPDAMTIRGPLFNRIFRRYGIDHGVTFADSDDVGEQFAMIRRNLVSLPRACA